ncbi:MAG: hypothetical protein HWN81_07870 [Candidatus Lokiarchaeota archaeon]|nr:hypothetical protein [Candidatus Lokiarchaeota archaeon]
MILQIQPPASGIGIMFLLPIGLAVGLNIALIYLIRKNRQLRKDLLMLRERYG